MMSLFLYGWSKDQYAIAAAYYKQAMDTLPPIDNGAALTLRAWWKSTHSPGHSPILHDAPFPLYGYGDEVFFAMLDSPSVGYTQQ